MSDCLKSMGKLLRELWPLSLCRRKPISFSDVESGLHSFGNFSTRVVLSPIPNKEPIEFVYDETTHKTGDLQMSMLSHRSTNPSHRTLESTRTTKSANGNLTRNKLEEPSAVRKDTPTSFCLEIIETRPICLNSLDTLNNVNDSQLNVNNELQQTESHEINDKVPEFVDTVNVPGNQCETQVSNHEESGNQCETEMFEDVKLNKVSSQEEPDQQHEDQYDDQYETEIQIFENVKPVEMPGQEEPTPHFNEQHETKELSSNASKTSEEPKHFVSSVKMMLEKFERKNSEGLIEQAKADQKQITPQISIYSSTPRGSIVPNHSDHRDEEHQIQIAVSEPSAVKSNDESEMPPIEISHSNGAIILPAENEKMIEAELPPSGYQRQKSTSSDKERRAQQRRLQMPLQYRRMYESVSEDIRGTIHGPSEEDFRPEAASKSLRSALSGIQSDDKTIIQILISHTNFQRQKIITAYQSMYSRSLATDIEEETGGYFLDATLALLQPAHVYSARILHRALSGRSSNRTIAVEIALTSSASQLKVIRDAYFNEYNISLEKDLNIKVEGLFGKMLQMVLLRNSDPDDVDLEVAENFVSMLSKTEHGLEELGRNTDLFEKIFASRGLNQVRAFIDLYDKHMLSIRASNETISDTAKSKDFESILRKSVNIHSEIRQLLLSYAKIAKNMQLYFAEQLKQFIGTTSDHASMTRIIQILVTRSEVDLQDICDEYKKKYGRHVIQDLQQTASGEFLRLLNSLINPNGNGDEVFSSSN